MRGAVALLALVTLTSCYTGPSANRYAPAQGPAGIAADLRISRRIRIRGELLEVQDTALLVLREQRVTFVPLRSIRNGTFGRSGLLIESGRMHRRNFERLRLISRFPSGLTADLRARLLAAYGQTEPDPAVP